MRQLPIQSRVHANGIDHAVYEWPGAPDDTQPPIALFHATSFHARCWDEVIRHLPGRRCIAFDARGHGRTDKPPLPYAWATFGADIVALADALDLRGAVGVGHSMGGHAVTRAAALRPVSFAGLVLVDPVIFPRAAYSSDTPPAEKHFTLFRRNRWASPDEMVARFKDRPPFNTWQPQVLRDYCDHGLLPAPDGDGYILACPPAVEAFIYTHSRLRQNLDVYAAVQAIPIPVRVLRAAANLTAGVDDLAASPTAPDLAAHFPRGLDMPLYANTHFIPMESPDLVAAHIAAVLDAAP